MVEQHGNVRMVIDINRQVVAIGNRETALTEQQVQVLAKLALKKQEFTSKEELRNFLDAKSPAVAQVVISRLRKRIGSDALTVLMGCGYKIGHAYVPVIVGDVKEQLTAPERKPEASKYKGESLRLSHQEDQIIQRWANACNKQNVCDTCADLDMCQKISDKLVSRITP